MGAFYKILYILSSTSPKQVIEFTNWWNTHAQEVSRDDAQIVETYVILKD